MKRRRHELQATHCPRIGAPCSEACKLALTLCDAMQMAGTFIDRDFETTGFGQLRGCAQTCLARFTATKSVVTIYCDVEANANPALMEKFAVVFFEAGDNEQNALPADRRYFPASIVRGLPGKAPDAERKKHCTEAELVQSPARGTGH